MHSNCILTIVREIRECSGIILVANTLCRWPYSAEILAEHRIYVITDILLLLATTASCWWHLDWWCTGSCHLSCCPSFLILPPGVIGLGLSSCLLCDHHQLAGQIRCRRREQKRYCNTYKSVHWNFESKANRGSVHSNCIFGQYSVHVVVSKCHRNPDTDSARRQKNLSPPPDEEQFWKTVDNQLENMRKTCVTPAALLLWVLPKHWNYVKFLCWWLLLVASRLSMMMIRICMDHLMEHSLFQRRRILMNGLPLWTLTVLPLLCVLLNNC